jgi:hypothetical protein
MVISRNMVFYVNTSYYDSKPGRIYFPPSEFKFMEEERHEIGEY